MERERKKPRPEGEETAKRGETQGQKERVGRERNQPTRETPPSTLGKGLVNWERRESEGRKRGGRGKRGGEGGGSGLLVGLSPGNPDPTSCAPLLTS